MSLIYYITNYATKDDVSPHQIVLKAALIKRSIEKAKAATNPDATDLRLQKKGMDQFALRCFNALSHDREISGVQIASSLLQLPNCYTENYNSVQLNLWWLRKHVRAAVGMPGSSLSDSMDPLGEERCAYQPGDTIPSSRFDNYNWRCLHLAHLCLFEYCMLVQTKNIRDAVSTDLEFDHNIPRMAYTSNGSPGKSLNWLLLLSMANFLSFNRKRKLYLEAIRLRLQSKPT